MKPILHTSLNPQLFFVTYLLSASIFYTIKSKTSSLLEALLPGGRHHRDTIRDTRNNSLPVSCRIACYICARRFTDNCTACVEKSILWERCAIPECVQSRGILSCRECPEHNTCRTHKEHALRCIFEGECMIELLPERFEMPEVMPSRGESVLLFKDANPQDAFESFRILINTGFNGLCITPLHPEVLRKKYHLPQVPVLRIINSKSVDGDMICTDNPSQLLNLIKKFIKRNPNSIVLLHGPEYLHTEKGFEDLLHFIQSLKNMAQLTRTQLLVSLNPDIFSEEELVALEQNSEMDEMTERVINLLTGSRE